MATVKTPQTSKLIIKVQTGTNAAGQAVYKVRSYANVKAAAADSDVLAVAAGLGNLQNYPVHSVSRIDEGMLVNQ